MKKLFSYMMVYGAMMTAVLGFTPCEDDLDVQQSYPFMVETMPVPKRLVQGKAAEIRCELKREGRFSDARYTIRYFQPVGKGTPRMYDGMVLLPNDRHPLDREVSRLYYTSQCTDHQSIDIYFEGNSEPAQILITRQRKRRKIHQRVTRYSCRNYHLSNQFQSLTNGDRHSLVGCLSP